MLVITFNICIAYTDNGDNHPHFSDKETLASEKLGVGLASCPVFWIQGYPTNHLIQASPQRLL